MRVDTWLWAARLFKSRTLATTVCRGGKVRVNGRVVKPANQVAVGDRVTWAEPLRSRDVEVLALLATRVAAPQAALAYVDHSPPVPPKELLGTIPMRERGAGRPEKRDRRDTDRLRGYQK